ncbi:MAG TPA: D-glycerate dehydrogenase [Candidatus Saccharimonadales bacterium]|nr:D-glycerate dehydrogenase [Candidatus Saccharimonadales bacterium]
MKLLITRKIPLAGIEILQQFPQIEIDYRQGAPLSAEELKKAIKDVEAIIPVIPDQITEQIIKAAPNLKLIATYSVGYDHIDLKTATAHKVFVANTPGDLTESVAEHAFALMLALGRKIVEADKYCREGDYKYWDPMLFLGPQFSNKTLGIVGFGRIGQHLAKIAHGGLNMKILYYDMKRCVTEVEEAYNAHCVSVEELLQNSDVVSLNCVLSPETHHLINDKRLRLMKPNAYLINTARGPVIDEEALVTALKENIIEGAALDVFENEPKIHPDLIKMRNVILTPHIASATREARIQMARMAAENVVDVLIKNQPPKNLVNTELSKQTISSLI